MYQLVDNLMNLSLEVAAATKFEKFCLKLVIAECSAAAVLLLLNCSEPSSTEVLLFRWSYAAAVRDAAYSKA